MDSIKIVATSTYLPNNKISNDYFNKKFKLTPDWIKKRTGIENRYYSKEENIVDLAIKVSEKLLLENDLEANLIDGIFVATTSTNKIMPGISFEVQRHLKIKKCLCLDILAGCSGYINAFDIARKYIACKELKNVLIIGVEKLSNFLDFEDKNTSVILGDGAGATLLSASKSKKKYFCLIESMGENNNILTCNFNEKLYMDGKNVYKFALSKTSENVQNLLNKNNINKNNIKYYLFHQSNIRIIENICGKLDFDMSKVYINLDKIGNTFCASIPIILDELIKTNKIICGDEILLVGYGGGLNVGSILLEY